MSKHEATLIFMIYQWQWSNTSLEETKTTKNPPNFTRHKGIFLKMADKVWQGKTGDRISCLLMLKAMGFLLLTVSSECHQAAPYYSKSCSCLFRICHIPKWALKMPGKS